MSNMPIINIIQPATKVVNISVNPSIPRVVNVQINQSNRVLSVNGKIGAVNLGKSDVGLGNVENVSILNVSGHLQTEINDLNSESGLFYLNTNPSGFVQSSGANFINRPSVNGTGVLLSGEAAKLPQTIVYTSGDSYISGRKDFVGELLFNGAQVLTGIDLSAYALNANTGSFVTVDQTGAFYDVNNPSGYITGVDLSTYALKSQTGQFVTTAQTGVFYAANNPSGYITGVDLTPYALNADLTGIYATYAQLTGLSGYEAGITNLLATYAQLTGYSGFEATVDAAFATYSQLTGLSGYAAAVTNLAITGSTLVSSINSLSGILTENYALKSQTGQFVTTSQTGAFYAANNPSGYITGIDLSTYALKSQTGQFVTTAQTGAFYAANNPSGYITGIDLSTYALKSQTGQFVTTSQTGAFYAANNPSGYITGIDLSNYVTLNSTQTIVGSKDFTTTPTVNSIPVLISGQTVPIYQQVTSNYNGTMHKGQVVYVNGSNGNNLLVSLASNDSEAASQVFGVLSQDISYHATGNVLTQGLLVGINTSSASAGDPVFLGINGNLLYGTTNEPYAPAQLIQIGYVVRSQQNNGSIFINIQESWEIDELQNVNIGYSYTLNDGDVIRYNASSGLWFNQPLNTGLFVTTAQTGTFYAANNPSGYVTGNVSLYANPNTIVQRDASGNIYGNTYYSSGNQLVLSDGVGINDSGNGVYTLSLNFSNGVYIGGSTLNSLTTSGSVSVSGSITTSSSVIALTGVSGANITGNSIIGRVNISGATITGNSIIGRTNISGAAISGTSLIVRGSISGINISGLNVPTNYYLKNNQASIGGALTNYFGTITDVLVPSGVYELIYQLYYTKNTAGVVTYVVTGNSQLASFVGNYIQTPIGSITGTQSAGVILTGSNTGAAFPSTQILTDATNQSATITCLVQNSGSSNTVYLATIENSGTITPLVGSYKKITRFA